MKLSSGILFFLVSIILLTSCANPSLNHQNSTVIQSSLSKIKDDSNSFWIFEPPITIRVSRLDTLNLKFQNGDSSENNIWTKSYKSNLGINLKYEYQTASQNEYEKYLKSSAVSNSLPDIFTVNNGMFNEFIEEERLLDISTTLEAYTNSSLLKSIKKSPDYLSGFRNKNQYGISQFMQPKLGVLWFRKEWLGNLGINMPENIEQVENIVRQFTLNDPDNNKNKDTLGLALDKNLSCIDALSGWYGAHIGLQLGSKDGSTIPSEIAPEWKVVLKKLNKWYKQGFIDFNYNEKDNISTDINDNKYGFVLGDESTPQSLLAQSITIQNQDEWVSAPSLQTKEENFSPNNYICINKNCTFPEALPLILNLSYTLLDSIEPTNRQYYEFQGNDGQIYPSHLYTPFDLGQSYSYKQTSYSKIKSALDSGNTSLLNGEQFSLFNSIQSWKSLHLPTTISAWCLYGRSGIYANKVSDLMQNLNVNKGTDPLFIGKEPAYIQYFNKIITNQYNSVEEGFDVWINYCKSKGINVANDL